MLGVGDEGVWDFGIYGVDDEVADYAEGEDVASAKVVDGFEVGVVHGVGELVDDEGVECLGVVENGFEVL